LKWFNRCAFSDKYKMADLWSRYFTLSSLTKKYLKGTQTVLGESKRKSRINSKRNSQHFWSRWCAQNLIVKKQQPITRIGEYSLVKQQDGQCKNWRQKRNGRSIQDQTLVAKEVNLRERLNVTSSNAYSRINVCKSMSIHLRDFRVQSKYLIHQETRKFDQMVGKWTN
jgi:hypothetical protein